MPNVVVLMSDEHNPRVSSVYGHPVVDTPNMQRLAERGTLFESAYTPSPLCLPARASFMSGRPVHEIQFYNNCNVFPAEYPSYGGVMASQGVHTVYAGKVDVFRPAEELGFSHLIQSRRRQRPGDVNFRREPLTIRQGARSRADGFGPKEGAFRRDTSVVDEALEWLVGEAPHLTSPWTLTVNTGAPHFPHYVTEELWEKYRDEDDLPAHGLECESAQHPAARDLRAHFETEHFSSEQVRGLRRGYLGCVEYVDRQLGRLIDALESTDALEDTVVVYTSDHGEMLGKFGMWWKCSLYEDSVRVPLIAAGPGFAPGARTATPVNLLDLQASIFRAVGASRPSTWWGTPLQDLPPEEPQERPVFSEYHGHGVRSSGFMVRKGPWKLIYYPDAPHQLFNLVEDPEELNNLAARRPDLLEEMERELRRFCSPEDEDRRAKAYERQQWEAVQREFPDRLTR